MQQKTKTDIFIATFLLLSFIAFAGLITVIAQGEGAIGSGVTANAIAGHTLYIFPLVFLSGLIKSHPLPVILILLAVNVLLYAFILAAVFHSRITKWKKYRPYTLSFYTLISILLFLFSFGIILIFRIF
jgi:hypothetical protein